MKNNNNHHHCGNPLCNTCGTTLDVSELDFQRPESHLLYTDKVYAKATGKACPIVFDLATTAETYQTQLFLSPLHTNTTDNLCEEIFGCCDCRDCSNDVNICDQLRRKDHHHCCSCCNECTVDETSVFTIINTYARVLSFQQATPCDLTESQVTLNGIPVDDLNCQSGLFEASLSQNLTNVLNRTCTENGLPTKAFFLISEAGPWAYLAEFVVEGTVSTAGQTCCFRIIFSPVNGAAPTTIPTTTSNLAIPQLSIPCGSGSALPRINFSFGGTINLLNPELITTATAGGLTFVLSTTGVAEPSVTAEVVKKTLFRLRAAESDMPCLGSENNSCCNCCNCNNKEQKEASTDENSCPYDIPAIDDDFDKSTESIQSIHCGNNMYF